MIVIGNGESRRHINLSKYRNPKVGCNAIFRDYDVDHLICVDRRMVAEALEHNIQCPIYTRADWIDQFSQHQNVTTVPELPYKGTTRPDEPFQWGSGPYAVLLSATMSKTIHMIGFDLWSQTPYVNNMYKSTRNYDSDYKSAVDPRYWIYQISKVFELFKDNYFIVYNDINWKAPELWALENVAFETLDNICKKV